MHSSTNPIEIYILVSCNPKQVLWIGGCLSSKWLFKKPDSFHLVVLSSSSVASKMAEIPFLSWQKEKKHGGSVTSTQKSLTRT